MQLCVSGAIFFSYFVAEERDTTSCNFHQMGNEASSVHIHSALTAEDLKALRSHFPGGGNSLEVKHKLQSKGANF